MEPETEDAESETEESPENDKKILKLNAAEGTASHVSVEEAVSEVDVRKFGPFKFHADKVHFKVRYLVVGAAAAVIVVSAALWFNTPEQRLSRAINHGMTAVKANDYTAAEKAYRTVLSIDRKNETAYLQMAEVYLNLDRHADAVQLIQEGIKEIPESNALKQKLEELNPVISFSKESGTYTDPVELTLETGKECSIMYSFKKENNRKEDQVYQEPLALNSNGKYQITAHAITRDGFSGPDATVEIEIKLDSKKYHLNDWSEAKDGSRSFIDANGNALTGWQEINGKKYYFDESGKEAVGKTTIGSDTYFFDEQDGRMTGWQKDENNVYYYFDEKGHMLTDTWIDDTFYVDSDGKMLTNTTAPDGTVLDNEGRKKFDFKSEIARYPDTMAVIESKTRKMDGDVATFKARIYHKHDKDKPVGDYFEATIRIHDHAWLHYKDQSLPDIWAKDAYNFLPTINIMNPTMNEDGVITKFDFILGSQK
jgi:glucan-binding repeat-containing protein